MRLVFGEEELNLLTVNDFSQRAISILLSAPDYPTAAVKAQYEKVKRGIIIQSER